MTTITIPRKITKGQELVILPRKEYERLFKICKKRELDKDLEEALEDVKKGRIIGPFSTAKEAIKALNNTRSR